MRQPLCCTALTVAREGGGQVGVVSVQPTTGSIGMCLCDMCDLCMLGLTYTRYLICTHIYTNIRGIC